jgi:hypothetical protein
MQTLPGTFILGKVNDKSPYNKIPLGKDNERDKNRREVPPVTNANLNLPVLP